MRTNLIRTIDRSEAAEWNCYAVYGDPAGPFVDRDGRRVVIHNVYHPTNLECRWVVDPTIWMPYEKAHLAAHGYTPVTR